MTHAVPPVFYNTFCTSCSQVLCFTILLAPQGSWSSWKPMFSLGFWIFAFVHFKLMFKNHCFSHVFGTFYVYEAQIKKSLDLPSVFAVSKKVSKPLESESHFYAMLKFTPPWKWAFGLHFWSSMLVFILSYVCVWY